MMSSRWRCLFFVALFLFVSATCHAGAGLPPFDPADAPVAPDYGEQAGWLSFPADQDQYAVDVFWVYPTVLGDDSGWLMDKNNQKLRSAARRTLVQQAAVFSGQANLYAPFYRQMNMAALALPQKEQDAFAEYGLKDVRRAFDYYMKHHNNGRPVILAAHSQGSMVLSKMLLKDWGALGFEKQVVAVYLIGWSVTDKDLKANPALAMCDNARQTGCFISYNTIAAGKQSLAPTIIRGAVVTNPLTWRTDGKKGAASLDKGSAFFGSDQVSYRMIPGFTSAQGVNGGLVIEPADPALVKYDSKTFPDGVYHVYDYSLFFENLRANAAERIQAFLNK